MTRYDRRHWLLAAGMSAVAGYVDATGFLRLGGLFVSFMSGNSTRMGVGLARDPHVASIAALLVLGFVAGVVTGSFIAAAAGRYRMPILLFWIGVVLALAAALGTALPVAFVTMLMTFAMGAANTVFQRDGEVSIGVTYMTGTLVKFGQRIASALMGGPRWQWVPYLALWASLVAGATAGALLWPHLGLTGLWGAAAAFWMLALYAGILHSDGPARHTTSRGQETVS